MLLKLSLLIGCLVFLARGINVFQVRESHPDEVHELMDFLLKTRVPVRYPYFDKLKLKTKAILSSFSWKNCGDVTKETFDLLKLTVTPDPIKLPGNLVLSFVASNKAKITSPLKASVSIEKKILGRWIEIPCVDHFGSCDYADLCSILSQIEQCPYPFIKAKIPCKCPLDEGNYTLPSSKFEIDVSFLPSGDYNGKIDLSMNSQSVGCYEVFLTFV